MSIDETKIEHLETVLINKEIIDYLTLKSKIHKLTFETIESLESLKLKLNLTGANYLNLGDKAIALYKPHNEVKIISDMMIEIYQSDTVGTFWSCDINIVDLTNTYTQRLEYLFKSSLIEDIRLGNLKIRKKPHHFNFWRSTRRMFRNCARLKHIDFGTIDSSSVIDIEGMFSECIRLEEVDLSSLKLDNIRDIELAFSECDSLRKIIVPHLTLDDFAHTRNIFSGSKNIEYLDMSSTNMSLSDLKRAGLKLTSNCIVKLKNKILTFDSSSRRWIKNETT